MKISTNVVFRKDKLNKQNRAPVHIRFTLNRQSRYVSTGVTLPLTDWDFNNNEVKRDIENAKQLQFQIDSKLNEYDKKIKRLEVLEMDISFESLLDSNSRRTPNQTVSEYFGKLIADIVYCYSEAHLYDLSRDKTEQKFMDMEYMSEICDDNCFHYKKGIKTLIKGQK